MFQNNNFKLPYGKHLECYLCKNCHFKQLQRAIAENEKLKAIADKALNDKNKWLDKYNILLSENEKLKLMLSEKYGVYK